MRDRGRGAQMCIRDRPMINHRGPEFAALMADVCGGIQKVLRTRNDVLLFPSSGTGGLEAAVANLLSPGEKALFCSVGSFGDRWADIATAYGVDVVRLKMPEGEAIDPEDVERLQMCIRDSLWGQRSALPVSPRVSANRPGSGGPGSGG